MEKVDSWPPPKWTEVVITWADILAGRQIINNVLEWIDTAPGGRYHLHGWRSTEGFAFRFEDPKDATYFKLKWL